jgi:peptidoglycan/xylan/chitin deacetylase (PgdA/CDA1 family)
MAEVFVIYYHKILPRFGFDVFYKTFDLEMKILKSFYNVVSLDEVEQYIKEDKRPNKPTVAITFDDGYVDNFVYAYPILKKHGLKATIFPIASRILQKDFVRPTLFDYWQGKVSFKELHQPKTMAQANLEYLKHGVKDTKDWDFLTVAELNKMKDVFDVGGHAYLHSRVFYDEEIIDFYDGKNGHWSFYYAYGEEPKIGFPILKSQNNLAVERSYIKKEVKDYVKSLDESYFKQKDWKIRLKKELLKKFDKIVDKEPMQERKERVIKELQESKSMLESMINQKIRHFAYPFGHYDDLLVELVGLFFETAFTTEKDVIKSKTNLHKIPRFGIPKDISSFIAVLGKAKIKGAKS